MLLLVVVQEACENRGAAVLLPSCLYTLLSGPSSLEVSKLVKRVDDSRLKRKIQAAI